MDGTAIGRPFLGPPSNERRGGALTPKKQFEIALKYYSDPGFQAGVSEIVGVLQPTVSRTVKYVTEQNYADRSTWIKFPNATAKFNDAGSSSYIPIQHEQLDDEVALINAEPDVLNLDLNQGTNSPSPASMMLGLSVGSKRPAPPALSSSQKRRKVEEELRIEVLKEQLKYYRAQNTNRDRLAERVLRLERFLGLSEEEAGSGSQ